MRNVVIVGISLAIIGVVVTLISLYWSYFSFLSIFVTDALWASVLLTVVLVLVNISSTLQARQTIREMEKARKAEFMPNVRMQLTWIAPTSLALKATNYGRAPALNIKAEITFLPSKIVKNWTADVFPSNNPMRFFLPDINSSKVCSSAAQIIVKGEYEDIFGQKFIIKENINTKQKIDEVNNLQVVDDGTYQ